MVKLLPETEIDPITEQVETVLDTAEEAAAAAEARRLFTVPDDPGDLSDGGMVGGVKVRPSRDKNVTVGRAAARQAWMWNGTVTVLPLAWTPDGKRHDGARHYLLKRHCLCCHNAGFFGRQCPSCVKNNCGKCRASTDVTTPQHFDNGETTKGWVIPNFYLRQEAVPYPARFYGSLDCFLSFCPRRGIHGFKTEQEMRLHAGKRHADEYKAHMDTIAAAKADQVDVLQRRVDELLQRQANQTVVRQAAQERMAHARAAKQPKAAVGVAKQ